MYIKNANLYFDKNNCVAFKNVKFKVDGKENFRISKNRKCKRIIHFAMEYNNDLSTYELSILFDGKIMPLVKTHFVDHIFVCNDYTDRTQLLDLIRRILKILCSTFKKLKKYYSKGIIDIKLENTFSICVFTHNDGVEMYASNMFYRLLSVHVDRTDFNNIDSINLNNMAIIWRRAHQDYKCFYKEFKNDKVLCSYNSVTILPKPHNTKKLRRTKTDPKCCYIRNLLNCQYQSA